jgi:hypothetical protein
MIKIAIYRTIIAKTIISLIDKSVITIPRNHDVLSIFRARNLIIVTVLFLVTINVKYYIYFVLVRVEF